MSERRKYDSEFREGAPCPVVHPGRDQDSGPFRLGRRL